MKTNPVFLFILFSLTVYSGQAQNLYFTRTGNISFFSQEVIENIEAHNKQVSSFLNINTGELVFSAPMKAFEFKKSLMQEHFNENYIESDKYPKSSFKGRIDNIETMNLQQDGIYTVKVKGLLTIHGVTQTVDTDGTLEVKEGKLSAKSVFYIKPEDYAIEIPLLVRDHIAKNIQVSIHINYQPYLGNTAK